MRSRAALLDAVRTAWGWCGVDPVAIVGENDFGNLILKDAQGQYWRLCPEELDCRVVARDRPALDELSKDQEFLADWHMRALGDIASQQLDVLPEGRVYCLKIPGVLGGEYGGDNLATIALEELVSFSGEIARHVKNLPDGAKVRLKIVD